MKNNVTLIGMPSAGKSTVGVLLAKRLGYSFIDVDLLIQEQEGKRLREIIEEQGLDGFLDVENRVNAGVEAEQAVIAPGGSVIYGKEAMEHLKSIGLVVYLKITYDELVKRVGDVKDRGVALKDGMTLLDLYHERISYFEKYADITIDEEGKELGAVVDELREILEERFGKKPKGIKPIFRHSSDKLPYSFSDRLLKIKPLILFFLNSLNPFTKAIADRLIPRQFTTRITSVSVISESSCVLPFSVKEKPS